MPVSLSQEFSGDRWRANEAGVVATSASALWLIGFGVAVYAAAAAPLLGVAFGFVLPQSLNLIGEFELRPGRMVLHVVGQVVGRRQRLASDCGLTTRQERT